MGAGGRGLGVSRVWVGCVCRETYIHTCKTDTQAFAWKLILTLRNVLEEMSCKTFLILTLRNVNYPCALPLHSFPSALHPLP